MTVGCRRLFKAVCVEVGEGNTSLPLYFFDTPGYVVRLHKSPGLVSAGPFGVLVLGFWLLFRLGRINVRRTRGRGCPPPTLR